MNSRNNRYLVLIIICLLMFSCTYGLKANALNYGAEFLGACTGDILIGIPSGLIVTLISQGPHADLMDMGSYFTFFLSAYAIGGSIGTPLGTILSGKIMHKNGSVPGAYIGGVIGGGLGLLTMLNNESSFGAVSFFLLPPICSVIGYNLSIHKNNSQSMFNRNIPQIGVSVLPEKHGDKITPKIGANILFRF